MNDVNDGKIAWQERAVDALRNLQYKVTEPSLLRYQTGGWLHSIVRSDGVVRIKFHLVTETEIGIYTTIGKLTCGYGIFSLKYIEDHLNEISLSLAVSISALLDAEIATSRAWHECGVNSHIGYLETLDRLIRDLREAGRSVASTEANNQADQTLETLLSVYRSVTWSMSDVAMDADHALDLNLDSFDLAELRCQLEERFKLRIAISDFEKLTTPQSVLTYITSHCAKESHA